MKRLFCGMMQKFLRDQRGAVVIDFIPVFFVLVVIVLFIFEIGIAYFLNIRSHKAAQIGARIAVTLPAVHASVPRVNVPANSGGRLGEPCFNPNGPSRCTDPGGPWVCRGSSLVGACDSVLFGQIVDDMRRTFPDLTNSAVTITYINRELGETGGRFVPEVNVAIEPHEYEFVVFSLGNYDRRYSGDGSNASAGNDDNVRNPATRYSGVSASAFGEDMSLAPTPAPNPGG